jgi:flagellar hook-length control protein FliK
MKISSKPINPSASNTGGKTEDKKKSNRFAQMLKKKQDKENDKQHASRGEQKNGQRANHLEDAAAAPASPLPNLSSVGLVSSQTTADSAKVAHPESDASAQIEKLATEMGHQIEVFRQSGQAQAVNLTFSSRELQGLQVQIRQQNGEMAIRFLTSSDKVSKLLSHHTQELRESLAGKGVKVSNIAIAYRQSPSSMQGRGYASV